MVLEILFHPTVWPHTNKHECIHNVLCIYVQAIESFTFANACILYTYTHTRMHTHTDIQTYMHTCIHTHTHTHTYTYIHKYKYKYACKYMHLSLSLYIYIHVIRLLFLSLWSLKNVLSKNVLFPKKTPGKTTKPPTLSITDLSSEVQGECRQHRWQRDALDGEKHLVYQKKPLMISKFTKTPHKNLTWK